MTSDSPGNRERVLADDRAVSPVVGVALAVAITVALAAVTVTMLLGVADPGVAPATDTAVRLDGTNAGTELTPEVTGRHRVDVRLDGESLATVDGESAGRSIFLPTAPGDEVLLVAADDETDVLVRETFEADEAGDFVAYYPLDDDGDELLDRSLNGNRGELEGDGDGPAWGEDERGTYREFDGSSHSVNVSELETGDTDVESFTVAVTFQADQLGEVRQLVEHNNDDGREWHVETTGDRGLQFGVDYNDGHYFQTDADLIAEDERHVVVGTYDGETYRLYIDGEPVGNATYEVDVDMERLRIGADDSGAGQHFDGRMYEFRLYYAAFDDHQVEMLTRAMG